MQLIAKISPILASRHEFPPWFMIIRDLDLLDPQFQICQRRVLDILDPAFQKLLDPLGSIS